MKRVEGRSGVERVVRDLVRFRNRRVSLGVVKNLIFGKVVMVSVRDPCMKPG